MANRTVKDASTVKGTNPQYLIEKVVRSRIYDSRYWKEECFALSAELLVDKGMELRFVGGVFGGNVKPSPFLCLQLKMLQIQPDKDIVIEFIRQEDSKYIRALGAMYLRLTFTSVEIYQYLEPLLNDYRKLRWMNKQGKFELMHMDEFVDRLLREERFCDIQLPRLQRDVLEETGQLQKRISLIDEELEYLSSSESEGENGIDEKPSRPNRPSDEQRKSRNRSPRRRSPSGGRRRDKLHKSADERQQRRSRSRHRSRSRDRRRQRRRSKEQLTTTGRRSP